MTEKGYMKEADGDGNILCLSTREHHTSKEYTEYSLMNKEAIVSTVFVFSHPS